MQRNLLSLALATALAVAAPLANADIGNPTVTPTTDAVNVTYNFTGLTFSGFDFSTLSGYGTGTLTGVSVNATLTASTNFTYANDLTIYVSNALAYGGQLQVGGFSDLLASETHTWANGNSNSAGTKVIDTVALLTPITFTGGASDPNIYLGNGYGDTDATGTWTGSVTLNFAAAVPEPESWALMLAGVGGLMAWTARRRRNASGAN